MDIYYISCVVLPLQYSVSRTIYIKVNSINEHGTKHLLPKLSKVKGISARVCCGYFFFLSSSPCVSVYGCVYWCTISRYTFSLIFIRRFATSVHLRSPAKNFKILLAYAVEIMFRYFIRALMKFTRKQPKTKKFLLNSWQRILKKIREYVHTELIQSTTKLCPTVLPAKRWLKNISILFSNDKNPNRSWKVWFIYMSMSYNSRCNWKELL